MNLIVLDSADFTTPTHACVHGRRARHVMDVHRASVGDVLRVGKLGGWIGTGTVLAAREDAVEFSVHLSDPPPTRLDVTLVLAMPRPKCFRRILQAVAALGVKRLMIIGAYRVEKSYWDSPWLAADSIREQMFLGLEQSRDTVEPLITLHPQFKPFVEDVLPAFAKGRRCLVAHPDATAVCPAAVAEPLTLVIGPEGGLTDYEVGRLEASGFERVSCGPRILRVEHMVPWIIGRTMML